MLVPTSPLPPKDNQSTEDFLEEMTYPTAEESLTEPTTEQPITDEQSFAPSPASQLPPEAQGEVNGGPLGCCLGTIAGLFLTVLLIVSASLLLANGANISLTTAPLALVGAVLGGYFGWKIGKKLYKEYDPPVLKERRPKSRRL
jgi:hypothetical protein